MVFGHRGLLKCRWCELTASEPLCAVAHLQLVFGWFAPAQSVSLEHCPLQPPSETAPSAPSAVLFLMEEPNPFGAPTPLNAVVANPFLENPPPTLPQPLAFQGELSSAETPASSLTVRAAEHHLSQGGYQAASVPVGAPGAAGESPLRLRVHFAITSSSPAGFPPPPQSLYTPAAPPHAAPEPKRAPGRAGYFSIASYTQYFDVDTADVLHRMRLACIPFGTSFASTVADKPDLCAALCAHSPPSDKEAQVWPLLDCRHAGVCLRGCWKHVLLPAGTAHGRQQPGLGV